ncbi:type II toxin-antitoxin system VapC family toxin [Leucobacter coleopterorum]|uniref:Ribonuclease VapC n=1 Tax=Leucobacter coleopterorum TaxID=2714933 RepID=A0ABX6JTN4_9MICO|nr:type II toxin-antitoxin system VapC family toxin [Leucobacter coleopterorum]QIM17568.1 type II toxin-antitoxin system VapC family toxin [Leucobacter coleopterorum]
MLVYVDTSALVKFVLPEPEHEALLTWSERPEVRLMTSDLTITEFTRAVRRANKSKTPSVREMLSRCGFVRLDPSLYEEAGRLEPHELRSLDAIHLAAALALGSQLDGMLTYDNRLAEAARNVGIRTISVDE